MSSNALFVIGEFTKEETNPEGFLKVVTTNDKMEVTKIYDPVGKLVCTFDLFGSARGESN